MSRGEKSRGGWLLFALVLTIVGGVGTWNYRRNLAHESAAFRPYATYSRADLEALIDAYEQEVESSREGYEQTRDLRAKARDRPFLDGRLREFERVQKKGRATRALGAKLAESEVTMKLLREEVLRRDRREDELRLFLRRLFVYRG